MDVHITDIETGIAPDYRKFMPEFEYRWKKQHTKQEELVDIKIQENEWTKLCPLHALTGRVIAIGHMSPDNKSTVIGVDETEVQILEHFWRTMKDCYDKNIKVVGHNIRMFDFPFLIRRSWKHKVKVPECIFKGNHVFSGIISDWIIDLSDAWLMDNETRYYRYQTKPNFDEYPSVRLLPKWNQNIISKFFGGTEKPFDGKNFEQMWNKDKAQAITYLVNDLAQVKYNMSQMLQEQDYEMPF